VKSTQQWRQKIKVDPLSESAEQKFWENFNLYLKYASPFLKEYAQWWRKALASAALLLVIGLVDWLVSVITGPDPKKWPSWIYPTGLVLGLTAVLHLCFLLICLFRIIRFLPTYFGAISWKRRIRSNYRHRDLLRSVEMRRSLMESVNKNMEKTNPEALKYLRGQGFL
jgi:Na+/melibiose symporter-like transporter